MDEARTEFKKAFGRMPRSRDRMLLAAYRYSPSDYRRQFLEIADKAGIPKHLVYAYVQTGGLMLTEENIDLASPQDISEVDDAVDQYFEALESGIDLLEPEMTPKRAVLSVARKFFEDATVALGSIADRAPRAVSCNQPLFFQFLLVSQCHQTFKTFVEREGMATSRELISLLRGLYECTLLIARLEADSSYSENILAQALAGSEYFPFRKSSRGNIDYSRIMGKLDGREFESRTSFRACAVTSGNRHLALFEIIYPLQSAYVHFNSLAMIQKYRELGSFLLWDERDELRDMTLCLITLTYCLYVISNISDLTKILQRDSSYFFYKSFVTLRMLVNVIDIESGDIDEAVMAAVIRAMELFTNQDFPDESDNADFEPGK